MPASGVRNCEGQASSTRAGSTSGAWPSARAAPRAQIQVTPLQMAMVAGAVGNGGVLMQPRLTERIVAKDGPRRGALEARASSRA